ncbi:hypothetical protein ACHAPT_008698 [Fusarium lateritium]
MKTWSLSAWCAGLENHQSEYQKWNVTKIEHMKSFHFSSVFHEYLRVTVKRQDKHGEASEPVVIFVEPMVSESSSNHDGGYSKHIGKFANITFGISKPIIDPLVKIIDLAHEKAGGGRRGDGA